MGTEEIATPGLYGIRRCNLRPKELWTREMFPVSFSVALVNRMWDTGLDLNVVSTDGSLGCGVSSIDIGKVYGCTKDGLPDTEFSFGTVYDPFAELAEGVPESELVLRRTDGSPVGALTVRNSVVPDAVTRDLEDELMGPEITVRTPLLKLCALSMADSLQNESLKALDILDHGIPEDLDWSDWGEVGVHIDRMLDNLDALERIFQGRQRPLILHTLWKSERDGPFLNGDAMDAFVWTDHAFTRLFLDGLGGQGKPKATRPLRCSVRLYLMMTSMLRGGRPDLDRIVASTAYGLPSEKEFIANGRQTNRIMACDRLTRPAVDSREVAFLGGLGFESMIMPERRLDTAVYHAVRTLRG